MSPELIEHNCPIEGEMMIEKDKPCNWCSELDYLIENKDDRETKTITH